LFIILNFKKDAPDQEPKDHEPGGKYATGKLKGIFLLNLCKLVFLEE
jgi:hypothetical protein